MAATWDLIVAELMKGKKSWDPAEQKDKEKLLTYLDPLIPMNDGSAYSRAINMPTEKPEHREKGKGAKTLADKFLEAAKDEPYERLKNVIGADPYESYINNNLTYVGEKNGVLAPKFINEYKAAISRDYSSLAAVATFFFNDIDWLLAQYEQDGHSVKTAGYLVQMLLAGALLGPSRSHLVNIVGAENIERNAGTITSSPSVDNPNRYKREHLAKILLVQFQSANPADYTTLEGRIRLRPGDKICMGRNPDKKGYENIDLSSEATGSIRKVSKRHLSILWIDDQWTLEDHSRNGTSVWRNGEALPPLHNKSVVLESGDIVAPAFEPGQAGFRFELG